MCFNVALTNVIRRCTSLNSGTSSKTMQDRMGLAWSPLSWSGRLKCLWIEGFWMYFGVCCAFCIIQPLHHYILQLLEFVLIKINHVVADWKTFQTIALGSFGSVAIPVCFPIVSGLACQNPRRCSKTLAGDCCQGVILFWSSRDVTGA